MARLPRARRIGQLASFATLLPLRVDTGHTMHVEIALPVEPS
jgi:hypothetical protein